MSLVGYSVPTTLTDDAGNTLFGLTVDIIDPIVSTATSDPDTGVLRLGPLAPGDYTISYHGRTAIIPVYAQAQAILNEVGVIAGAPVQSVAGRAGDVVLSSADLTDGETLKRRDSSWQPSTDLKAGQTVIHAGIIYTADVDFTTPSVFDDDNLTAIAGVVAISAVGGTTKSGVVTIDAEDITTADNTGVASKGYVDSRVAGDIIFEDVNVASYDFVAADATKCKRFLVACAARILPGVFTAGQWVNGMQKGTGQVTITGELAPQQITFPYTLESKHETATTSHTIAVPSGADIQDHDLVFFFIQIAGTRTWVPHSGTGAVFTQEGPQAGVSGGAGLSTLFRAVDVTASAIKGQTLTFSFTGTAVVSDAILVVVRGAHRTSPIDAIADSGIQAAGSAGSLTAPALTTVNAGCVELDFIGKSSGNNPGSTTTPPSPVSSLIASWTNVGAGNCSTAAGSYGDPAGLPAGTAIGSRIWTPAPSVSVPGNARTVSIRPHVPTGVLFDASDGTKTVDKGSVFTVAAEGVNGSGLEEFLITGKLTT